MNRLRLCTFKELKMRQYSRRTGRFVLKVLEIMGEITSISLYELKDSEKLFLGMASEEGLTDSDIEEVEKILHWYGHLKTCYVLWHLDDACMTTFN